MPRRFGSTEEFVQLASDQREEALELMLHETRIISASLANLAEMELDAIGALIHLGLRRELLAEAIDRGIDSSDFGWLIMYVLRHELAAALRWRAPADAGDGCRDSDQRSASSTALASPS